MNALKLVVALMLTFVVGIAQAETIITVKSSDTVSKIAQRYGVKTSNLCAQVKGGNCNVIRPGQKFVISIGAAAKSSVNSAVSKSVSQVHVPTASASGEFLWKVVGGAPLRGCGAKDDATINAEAWQVHGISPENQEELKKLVSARSFSFKKLSVGERFESVTFCEKGHAVLRTNVVAAWDMAKTVMAEEYVLSDGTVWYWVRNCGNWVPGLPQTPKAPELPPQVVVKEPPQAPPPVVAEPPKSEEPPVSSPPVAEKKQEALCEFDPKLVFGEEYEPQYRGDHSKASYLSAAAYCTWRGKDGTHGLGAMLLASKWNGTVNHGAGHFDGSFVQYGPSYEYIADDGWDLQIGLPMFGKLKEHYQGGEYESHRNFRTLGVTASANFYQPKMDGKEWFYETQVSGTAAVPVGKSVSHTWQGREIADTSELSKLSYYANVTVREYITRVKTNSVLGELELYGQTGFLFEIPGSRMGELRVGVAGFERCVGVGAGVDFNLISDSVVPAWGWWVDGIACANLARAEYRRQQVKVEAKEMGVEIDPKTKAIRIVDPDKFYQSGSKQ